ncbi:hypothetical protein AtNW77_Chr1g0000811 [Arabidopsis thaliana]|uniref:Uncharacterized protein n=1 Tax=Arabidopsis thaliana TaxID=3702 RepID=A0A1P8AM80_ARATH|nr:uncharacterized protein AT1G01715 [Arabidopsis thaliana]NP_001320212.1 uncharacterized protein AT1G01715 [Arabidopsis thaliana]ANM57726.1 hypothetical protein AT1G01715 [Arabidopsis thaliana]ANM57727.1 hypothetical protein AT1G01715 [Arabidopsis thaliana]|eukprot:NP_001320211.1 hypothetical protein AT1G01715 [Arabidopsis thaliana]
MAFEHRNEDLNSLDSEEDLEKMESEVEQMSRKVSEYRKSLPSNLSNSVISSRRSNFPNIDSLGFRTTSTALVSRDGAHIGGIEQESRDSLIQLKERVYENIATVPLVVERMRESKERIDKSISFNGTTMHPAFTRRKAS